MNKSKGKYHVEIPESYWKFKYPAWEQIDSSYRDELIKEELEAVSNFLRKELDGVVFSPFGHIGLSFPKRRVFNFLCRLFFKYEIPAGWRIKIIESE